MGMVFERRPLPTRGRHLMAAEQHSRPLLRGTGNTAGTVRFQQFVIRL